jgi:hypothetical protein
MEHYIINLQTEIIRLNKYNYYNIAQNILANLHRKTFKNKSIPIKKELSFWSSFVNKNYSIVINDIYTKNDIRILRKEIELVAEFKLDKCSKVYLIHKKM